MEYAFWNDPAILGDKRVAHIIPSQHSQFRGLNVTLSKEMLAGLVGLGPLNSIDYVFAYRDLLFDEYVGYDHYINGNSNMSTTARLSGILPHNNIETRTNRSYYLNKFVSYQIGSPERLNMSFVEFMGMPRHKCDQYIALVVELAQAERKLKLEIEKQNKSKVSK